MRTTEGWWGSSPVVEIAIGCAEHQHHLRWDAGTLLAPDHGDADGERVLGALGARRPPCIAALEAWERHEDDLRVLTLASRGPADVIQNDGGGRFRSGGPTAGGMLLPGVARWRMRPAPGTALPATFFAHAPKRAEPDDLLFLHGLSPVLWDRLVATVVQRWNERVHTVDRSHPASAALIAALTGRVIASLRQWLGRNDIDVVVEMIPPDATPELWGDGASMTARLPFRWLSEVWMPGAAVVFGRFTLARLESRADLERLLTISADLEPARVVSVRLEPPASSVT